MITLTLDLLYSLARVTGKLWYGTKLKRFQLPTRIIMRHKIDHFQKEKVIVYIRGLCAFKISGTLNLNFSWE